MGVGVPAAAAQAVQVVTVAAGAPWVSGVIGRIEARLQGRRGTRVLQPYYDLAKLFTKESLTPEGASWVFLATPPIAFSAYLTVPLLIPVLTNYPLPLGYMGDILGGWPHPCPGEFLHGDRGGGDRVAVRAAGCVPSEAVLGARGTDAAAGVRRGGHDHRD